VGLAGLIVVIFGVSLLIAFRQERLHGRACDERR
jgi:hypothetical protein